MCARTQFMTDSFLWADRPIMSKTNETMKHNAEAKHSFTQGNPRLIDNLKTNALTMAHVKYS